MGFALWVEDGVAKAQGTHEYRPMGVAVISFTGVFQHRDFNLRAKLPNRTHRSFVGLFASLNHVNHFLAASRSQAIEKKFRPGSRRQYSII